MSVVGEKKSFVDLILLWILQARIFCYVDTAFKHFNLICVEIAMGKRC